MKTPVASPGTISNENMADLMLRTTGLANAIVHSKGAAPLCEQFHRAMALLIEHAGEQAGSLQRHALVAFIARKPLPEFCTREGDRMSWGRETPHYTLEEELQWMEGNVDRNSYTSLMLLADLYREAGFIIEERMAAEKAMALAREKGLNVWE